AQLGGTVQAPDARASLQAPLGALSADTVISITSLAPSALPAAPAGLAVMAAVQVAPLGLHFQQPVTLQFPVLNPLSLPAGTVLEIYTPQNNSFQATNIPVISGVGGTTLLAT